MRFLFFLTISILLSQTSSAQEESFVDYWDEAKTIKRSEGMYFSGMEHKLWTFWYDNGKVREESNYFRGRFNGPSKIYHPNGQLNIEAYWDMGLQDSIMKVVSFEG